MPNSVNAHGYVWDPTTAQWVASTKSDDYTPIVPSNFAVRGPRTDRKVIADTQTGHSWTITGTVASSNLNDTTDYVLGTQCVSLLSNSTGVTCAFRKDWGSGSYPDFTNKGIVLWLYIDNWSAMQSAPTVQIIDSSGANAWVAPVLANVGLLDTQQYASDNEWAAYFIPWSAFTKGTIIGSNPTRNAVSSLRVNFYPKTGYQFTAKINGLGTFVEPATVLPNGMISLTYDDTYLSHFSIVRPYLDKYGFRATLYPIVDQLGIDAGHYTLVQLQQMHDRNGYEVGYHATTSAIHAAGLPSLTSKALASELAAGRVWQQNNGFADSTSMAWPRGYMSPTVITAVNEYWSNGRSISGVSPEIANPVRPYRLRCINAAGMTLAQLQTEVDKAKLAHAWTIFLFHDVAASLSGTDSQQQTTAIHNGLIDYISSQSVNVLPVGEAMQIIARY